MICYVCEHEFSTPKDIISIIACPNCKKNIVTDGSESATIEDLNLKVTQLTSELNEKELIIEKDLRDYKHALNGKDDKIKRLNEDVDVLDKELVRLEDELRYENSNYEKFTRNEDQEYILDLEKEIKLLKSKNMIFEKQLEIELRSQAKTYNA